MGDMYMMAFADILPDGTVKKLSMTTMDYIPVSAGRFIFDLALLICAVISGLCGFIALIVLLIRKLRKKEQVMVGLRGAVYGSTFIALLNFILLMLSGMPPLAVHGILFILSALIPIVCTALIIYKKQMRRFIIPVIMGLIVTFNILNLELWMFWV
jgi:hypothetical protein